MGPNLYLYEKALEVHHQDLRHEMEARRLLCSPPSFCCMATLHLSVSNGYPSRVAILTLSCSCEPGEEKVW